MSWEGSRGEYLKVKSDGIILRLLLFAVCGNERIKY